MNKIQNYDFIVSMINRVKKFYNNLNKTTQLLLIELFYIITMSFLVLSVAWLLGLL